jgi:signal transduction histidine kinase
MLVSRNLRNFARQEIMQHNDTAQKVQQEIGRVHFGRVRLYALILLALHCYLLYQDLAVLQPEGYWERNIGYKHLFEMHLAIVVICAVFFFLPMLFPALFPLSALEKPFVPRFQWKFKRRDSVGASSVSIAAFSSVQTNPNEKSGGRWSYAALAWYNYGFAFLVLCWSALLAGWVNQHEHGLITEYIIAMFGVAASFSFPFWQSAAMFASAQTIFMLAVAQMFPENPNGSGHFVNTIAMSAIALALARTARQLTVSNIENQMTIYRQARDLEQNILELMRQNERLEQLDAEKSELMGIAAHDLKNPISGIILAVDAMRFRIENALEEDGGAARNQASPPLREVVAATLQNLEGIDETAKRMISVINNLLSINRLESGRLELRTEEFDARSIVHAVCDMQRAPAMAKGIEIIVEERGLDGSFAVLADAHFTQEAVENLVSNAVKYSPLGKRVWVRVDSVSSSSEIWVEVLDEGPGISSEDQKKLFGKFARLSAQPTGGEHSTGLGLSIVKKLAEAMGGRVWCESELGEGAKFTLALPRAAPEEVSVEQEKASG